jgi:hypothetical protein
MPKVFMADGGLHFAGAAVGEWCIEHNSQYQQGCVHRIWVKITKFEDSSRVWLDHFDTVIKQLNGCI